MGVQVTVAIMATRLLVPAVLLTAALTGCSDDGTVAGPPASPSATTSPAAPTPTTAATAAAPFPADTRPDSGAPSGGQLTVKAVRVAAQPGFDRVVFDLAGAPGDHAGWRVEYVASPASDGSGDPVQVKGSAYLQVVLSAIAYPTGSPGPKRLTTGTQQVREVVVDGVFEGQYTAFIGLTTKKPFRVFRLSSPERVVVDVQR